jgi:hypothetical protein
MEKENYNALVLSLISGLSTGIGNINLNKVD